MGDDKIRLTRLPDLFVASPHRTIRQEPSLFGYLHREVSQA